MTAMEEWLTVWLRIGIQKSMPFLVKQIKAIRLESERGTLMWISKVEPASGKKVYVQIQFLKAERHEELLGHDIDSMLQTLKATIAKIVPPGYKKEDPIVKGFSDGHAMQDRAPAAF